MAKAPRRGDRKGGLNESILDALVRHEIFLGRLAGGMRDRFVAILNQTETALRGIITGRSQIGSPLTTRNLARGNALIRDLLEVRVEAWDQIVPGWRAELREIVRSESAFMTATYDGAAPVVLDLAPASLTGIASKTKYNGRTTTGWLRNMRANDLSLVNTTVRISIAQGETPKDMAVRLMGRRALGGRDGALQTTRNNIAAMSRTGITAMTAQTKRRFAEANAAIMVGEQFVAVLDGFTTPICRSLDGQIFPIGEGRIPPLHIRCRSIRQPLIDGQVVGNRTATPLFRRRTLNEYADENNISRVTKRADLPFGHKGAFDSFSQQKAFEVVGPNVPVSVSYEDWLRRQPVRFQNDVLGVTKGKLFRQGNLSLDRFVDSSDRELSLFEVAQRDRSAFVAAGLDPDDALWKRYLDSANPGGGN